MRALVVLLLAGCWHDVPPPQMAPTTETTAVADDDPPITRRHRRPGGPDCSSLGPAMEQIFSRYTGFQNQMAPILEAVTQSCTEDGWSMDLVQCFIDASDDHRAQECANLLTKEQMESFQNRLMTAMTQSAPQPPPPPPATPSN